jgi:hypothetical protein
MIDTVLALLMLGASSKVVVGSDRSNARSDLWTANRLCAV